MKMTLTQVSKTEGQITKDAIDNVVIVVVVVDKMVVVCSAVTDDN